MAKAVITELAPKPKRRRRNRREETERAFKMARALTIKVKQTIIRFMYSNSRFDPKAERDYAEQVLRRQMEEWSREEDRQDESFDCASAAGFDPHL